MANLWMNSIKPRMTWIYRRMKARLQLEPISEVAPWPSARSAGFQPAVSQVSNLQMPETISHVFDKVGACRLDAGDTAGWETCASNAQRRTPDFRFDPRPSAPSAVTPTKAAP